MAQTGLHAYLAFKLANKMPKKEWLLFAFIMGSVIPDLDIILTSIFSMLIPLTESVKLTHRTFSHSIFTFIIVYLLFLIVYEITKDKKYKMIGNGLILGFMTHLIFDVLFWFDSVHLFWPLPIDRFDIWYFFENVNINIKKAILLSEFIFFRLFAYQIMEIIISSSNKNGRYLKHLSMYMKIQVFYFIIFGSLCLFFKTHVIYYLFGLFYIPSLIAIIYLLYKVRESFNDFILYKGEIQEYTTGRKTSIQNIE